jgi:hypothetical protein
MNHFDTELTTNWVWLNVDLETTYKLEERVEECHGLHTFLDSQEISCQIIRVVIKTKDGDIDITNRLTKEELDLLKEPIEPIE